MIRFIREKSSIYGAVKWILIIGALFIASIPGPARAQVTISVMVDHLDTGHFGATTPTGITFIPHSGNTAVVDYGNDTVFVVDENGILQRQFDTTTFGALNPQHLRHPGPKRSRSVVITAPQHRGRRYHLRMRFEP